MTQLVESQTLARYPWFDSRLVIAPPVPDLPWWRPLCHELLEAHVPSEIYLFFGIGSQNTKISLPENSKDTFQPHCYLLFFSKIYLRYKFLVVGAPLRNFSEIFHVKKYLKSGRIPPFVVGALCRGTCLNPGLRLAALAMAVGKRLYFSLPGSFVAATVMFVHAFVNCHR